MNVKCTADFRDLVQKKSDILNNKINSPDHTSVTMATRCVTALAGRTSPWDFAALGLAFGGFSTHQILTCTLIPP